MDLDGSSSSIEFLDEGGEAVAVAASSSSTSSLSSANDGGIATAFAATMAPSSSSPARAIGSTVALLPTQPVVSSPTQWTAEGTPVPTGDEPPHVAEDEVAWQRFEPQQEVSYDAAAAASHHDSSSDEESATFLELSATGDGGGERRLLATEEAPAAPAFPTIQHRPPPPPPPPSSSSLGRPREGGEADLIDSTTSDDRLFTRKEPSSSSSSISAHPNDVPSSSSPSHRHADRGGGASAAASSSSSAPRPEQPFHDPPQLFRAAATTATSHHSKPWSASPSFSSPLPSATRPSNYDEPYRKLLDWEEERERRIRNRSDSSSRRDSGKQSMTPFSFDTNRRVAAAAATAQPRDSSVPLRFPFSATAMEEGRYWNTNNTNNGPPLRSPPPAPPLSSSSGQGGGLSSLSPSERIVALCDGIIQSYQPNTTTTAAFADARRPHVEHLLRSHPSQQQEFEDSDHEAFVGPNSFRPGDTQPSHPFSLSPARMQDVAAAAAALRPSSYSQLHRSRQLYEEAALNRAMRHRWEEAMGRLDRILDKHSVAARQLHHQQQQQQFSDPHASSQVQSAPVRWSPNPPHPPPPHHSLEADDRNDRGAAHFTSHGGPPRRSDEGKMMRSSDSAAPRPSRTPLHQQQQPTAQQQQQAVRPPFVLDGASLKKKPLSEASLSKREPKNAPSCATCCTVCPRPTTKTSLRSKGHQQRSDQDQHHHQHVCSICRRHSPKPAADPQPYSDRLERREVDDAAQADSEQQQQQQQLQERQMHRTEEEMACLAHRVAVLETQRAMLLDEVAILRFMDRNGNPSSTAPRRIQ